MITAIVLAAGQSRRMGSPKINLPWGETTVLGKVLATLLAAGLEEILLVTGAHPVDGLESFRSAGVKPVFNPNYAAGEMLSSFQAGLQTASAQSEAALLVLGDQPQIEPDVLRAILGAYRLHQPPILVPSWQMRRGHPWIVHRSLWGAVLDLPPGDNLRAFLNAHADQVTYLPVESESILQDLDTPQDYRSFTPKP